MTRQWIMETVSQTATVKLYALLILSVHLSCHSNHSTELSDAQQASYEACLFLHYTCPEATEACLACLNEDLPLRYQIVPATEVANCLQESHNTKQALDILRQVEFKMQVDPELVPRYLKGLLYFWKGYIYEDLEQYDAAIEAYQVSRRHYSDDRDKLSRISNNLANLFRLKFQRDTSRKAWLDSTLKYRQASIQYYKKDRIHNGFSNLSVDYRLKMELDSAIKNSQKAIDYYHRYSQDGSYKLSSIYEHYAKALYLQGSYDLASQCLDSALRLGPSRLSDQISIQAYFAKCKLAQNNFEAAFEAIQACDTLVKTAQSEIEDYSDKVLLSTESNTAFSTAIEAAFKANDPESLWYYAERNKANALYEVIARVRQKTESNFTIPKVSELQSRLRPKTVLLNYIHFEGKMLLFALKQDAYEIFALDRYDPDEIKEFISQLYEEEGSLYRQKALKLYQTYVRPAASFLEGSQELLIIPDAYLHFLPFDVLIHEESKIPSKALSMLPKPEEQFLIEKYRIKYNVSAAMAFRAPATNKDFEFTFTGLSPTIPDDMPPLPEAPKEVKAISQYISKAPYSSKVLLADQAQERYFQSMVSTRILHFSTHHHYDRTLKRPALYLSKTREEEDGFLFSDEIFNYPMQIETVVLSNCQGVRGEYRAGEGVLNLSQAFLTQGAENIIYSLWSVEDSFTREFMETFYRKLVPNFQYAQALHETKLEMMKKKPYQHPLYWAGFSLLCGL